MSEIAVAEMRQRMLKDTEGYLAERLAFTSIQRTTNSEFVEYVRRCAVRSGQTISQQLHQDLTL